jgi:hypothetical protein
MIIAFRNDKAYLIMAAAVNDVELSGAVEHVLATWKWEDSQTRPMCGTGFASAFEPNALALGLGGLASESTTPEASAFG